MAIETPPALPTPLPADPPIRGQRATFSARMDAFVTWLFTAVAWFVSLATNVFNNATEAFNLAGAANTSRNEALEYRNTASSHKDAAAASALAASASANLNGTSTTVRTPATGSMTWAYADATGKLPQVGARGRSVSRANPTTNYALWTVTGWASPTLTVEVDDVGPGPLSASDWNIIFEGAPGPAGNDAEVRSLVQTRSANGTITAADLGATLRCTATITLAPDSAASLGDGFSTLVDAPGHVVTITGLGTVPAGGLGLMQSDGTTNTLRLLGAVSKVLHVRDEKTSGTAGGAGTTGVWQKRDLNTVVVNEIAGASLASNEVTLPAGVYDLVGSVPGVSTSATRARLYNETDAALVLDGPNEKNDSSYGIGSRAFVRTRLVLTATKALSLRMRQQTAPGGSQEFGGAASFGVPEVYSDLYITKIG